MANVLAVVAFVLGVVIPASCLGVWTAVMLPGPVARARDRAATSPLLCLVWGGFAVAVAVVVLLLLLPVRDAGFRLFSDALAEIAAVSGLGRFANDARILTHLTGWLAVSPVMTAWVIGSAGLATLFAERARPGAPAHAAVVGCGSMCLHFSYFLPFVGWFVFAPVVGCLSVGAGFLALLPRRVSEGADISVPRLPPAPESGGGR